MNRASIRFLPVVPESKWAFVSKMVELCNPGGWKWLNSSLWSHPKSFHAWSDREPDNDMEKEEKRTACTVPAFLTFIKQ